MEKTIISIAIDGPASAGKSTIAKEIANKLGFTYIDTGAMYRALTYKIMKSNLDINNPENVKNLELNTDISLKEGRVILDGSDISDAIRQNVISQNVSQISAIPEIRSILLKAQKEMAKKESVVMDGRDIGTVVLPKADYKFFITASIKERARRRYLDLVELGDKETSLEQLEIEIEERDRQDMSRDIAPLKKAKDAILIDNTDLSIGETVDKILNIIKSENNVL